MAQIEPFVFGSRSPTSGDLYAGPYDEAVVRSGTSLAGDFGKGRR